MTQVNLKFRETSSAEVDPPGTTVKGSPLTNTEIDANFKSIKDAIETIDTSPVQLHTTIPIASSWAYVHENDLNAHGISDYGETLVDDLTAADARDTLGLGTIATQAHTAVNIDGGSIDGASLGGSTPITLCITSSLTATTADINGGTIDNTVIGNSTPLAGTFTNLTANDSFIVGKNDGGDAVIQFYDDNSDTTRSLFWDDSENDWRIENNSGSMGKLWHQNNDGTGSGLDADLLDGQQPSTSSSANSIAQRNSSGNLYANTFYGALIGNVTGTATDCSRTVTAGDALTGGGTLTGNITINHEDTSSQASVNNSNGNVIQDITLDTYGHVTALGSTDLDTRYVQVTNLGGYNYAQTTGDTFIGDVTLNDNVRLELGTGGGDWALYCNGTDLYIKSAKHGSDFFIQGEDDAGVLHNMVYGDPNSQVKLYYDGVPKLYTDSNGAVTVGTHTATTFVGALTGTATDCSRTVTAGSGLTGGGALTGNITLSHSDTSSQASVNNSNGTVIQDITLDTYGHVTALGSYNLDGRYYTESESDSRFLGISANAVSATTAASCTGNAATATQLASARTINSVSFNGTGNIVVEPYIADYNTGDTNCPIVFTIDSGPGYKRLYEDSAIYIDNTNNRIYAAAFYDSAGTYYCDPASTSNLNAVTAVSANIDTITGVSSINADSGVIDTINSDSANIDAISCSQYDGVENDVLSAGLVVNARAANGCFIVGSATTGRCKVNNGDFQVSSLAGTGNRLVYSSDSGILTNSSSDERLKENIKNTEYGLNEILAMRPVVFNWKDRENMGNQTELGLIAQEVRELVPEVIGVNKNKGTTNEETLSLDYPKLIPVLINAIKELKEELNSTQEELNSNQEKFLLFKEEFNLLKNDYNKRFMINQ